MEEIKLICFDLDDTLITHNSWFRLNAGLGITREQDKYLYDEYIAGRLGYDEWNQKLLELYLKHDDATREGMTKILSAYQYADHVKEAVGFLKKKGYELALISGSIDILVSVVADDLGIPYRKANNALIFDEAGRLTGVHSGGTDTHAKLRYLENFAELLGIPITQCACIGDGANDIEMFRKTGRGITFKGSSIESEAWKVIESLKDLEEIFT